MSQERSVYIQGVCPFCGAPLDYTEGDATVVCPVCERTVTVGAEAAGRQDGGMTFRIDDSSRFQSLKSCEDATTYFDRFCKSYDWSNAESFAMESSMELPHLSALADACKIAFPQEADAYVLECRTLTVPASHLLDAVEALSDKIADQYAVGDLSSLYDCFDEYRILTALICRDRQSLKNKANLAIEAAKDAGATNQQIYDLQMDVYNLSKRMNAVEEPGELLDMAPLRNAEELRQEKIVKELADRGIDAEINYQAALKAEEDGESSALVLKLLESVRGYKDTERRIEAINSFFYFGNRYLEIGNKKYYTRNETYYNGIPTYSLFEIHDGKPDRSPALTGISRILKTYGNYIFFLRDEQWLCLFDVSGVSGVGGKILVLDSGKPGDFLCSDQKNEVLLSSDGKTFYLRKKLPIEWKKTGFFSWCFSLFRKKAKGVQNKFNNYSVLAVNMEALTCKTLIPEAIDVMDFVGDTIFYTTMPRKFEYDVEFRSYNCKTGEDKLLLNSECVIHYASSDLLVFSLFAPNADNMNLYALHVDSGETVLLERNVDGFFALNGDRVYYTVHLGDEVHLASVKTDGTLRREVIAGAQKILSMENGVIYYVKGTGRNAVLMKVDLAGEHPIALAGRYEKTVRLGAGYLYYINCDQELHRVLSNGTEDTVILRRIVSDDIIASRKNVFFYGWDKGESGEVLSLYRLLPASGILRKVAYNVKDFKEFDADTVFFTRTEDRLFRMPTIDARDEKFYKEEFLERKTVRSEVVKFCKYDKQTGLIEDVLTLGIPAGTGAQLLPVESSFKRADKAVRGEIYHAVREAAPEKNKAKANAKTEKRQAKIDKKFAKRKKRADRRANRQKKKAIRRGLYPALPRYATYENAIPFSLVAEQKKSGNAAFQDDLNGKI